MVIQEKTTYYLNGKEVKEIDLHREGLKSEYTLIVTHRFYTAPLTQQEIDEKHKDAINAHNYFNKQREIREDLEKYHG